MNTSNNARMPRVSIIIPAYNTATYIGNCLDSVFSQTYVDYETVVVNDGSPDTADLEKVLAPYRDRIIYVKQENKRAAGARNTAIRAARGEFLAFLDSDDCWLPHHLAQQMKRFEEDASLDLVYSNCVRMGDPRLKFMDRCPSRGPANFESLILERCQIPISTVVARKQVIVKAGGFDEHLLRCDDYDMWVRAAYYGAKIGYSLDVQAQANAGRPGSLALSSVKMLEAYLIILEKQTRTLPLSGAQRKFVSTRISDIQARYFIEQAKTQLGEGRFDQARQLFVEANKSLRQWKVSLALFGLSVAPVTTSKVIFIWQRVLSGS